MEGIPKDWLCPGSHDLSWVVGDAEALPFPDKSMDGYTIAFGLRNVTQIPLALKEAHRVSPAHQEGETGKLNAMRRMLPMQMKDLEHLLSSSGHMRRGRVYLAVDIVGDCSHFVLL